MRFGFSVWKENYKVQGPSSSLAPLQIDTVCGGTRQRHSSSLFAYRAEEAVKVTATGARKANPSSVRSSKTEVLAIAALFLELPAVCRHLCHRQTNFSDNASH